MKKKIRIVEVRQGWGARLLFQAVLVGLLAGMLVVLFKSAVESFWGGVLQSQVWHSSGKWVLIPLLTSIGGLIAGILVFGVAPETSGSGIPYIKLVLARIGSVVRFRSIWVKFLAGVAGIGTGMPLGREGPSVQLGAGAGMVVAKFFRETGTHMNKLIAAGSGSALGAVFNAPIAGTIFVFEELLHKFSAALLFPVLVATVVAASLARAFLGDFPSFDVPSDLTPINVSTLGFCLLLGVAAGVLGVCFSKCIFLCKDLFARLYFIPNWAKPALAGLGVGLLALWEPRVTGSGNQAVELLLFGHLNLQDVLLLLILRFFLTSFCFSSGAAGGIFLPMLMIGSFLGFACGEGGALLGINPNSLAMALAGMAAFMAAVARTPITSVVMVFEMTGAYHYVLPIMVCVAMADLVAGRLGHKPIYTMLEFSEMSHSFEAKVLAHQKVKNIIRRDVLFVDASMYLIQAFYLTKKSQAAFCLVRDNRNRLSGILSFRDVEKALIEDYSESIRVDMVMNPSPLCANLNLDLFSLYFYMLDDDHDCAVVFDKYRKVVGIVDIRDIYDVVRTKKQSHKIWLR